LICLPHVPRDAAVDRAALRGELPGHALPRALRLDAGTGGGGAVLARLRQCGCGGIEGAKGGWPF
jgi:hypothetical protein